MVTLLGEGQHDRYSWVSGVRIWVMPPGEPQRPTYVVTDGRLVLNENGGR